MNETICVRLIVSEATRIRQEWVVSSDFPGYSQGVDAKILVLCDSRTMLCSVSTLRLLSILRHWWFCKQILVDICVQECCVYVNFTCDVVASFSETVSTVLVRTSRAVCAPDIYCSPSRLTWISLVRLSLNPPTRFEPLCCPLPQTSSQLSSHPFLSVSSAASALPSSFLRDRKEPSTSASRCLRPHSSPARSRPFVSVFTTFGRFSSIFMTDLVVSQVRFLHQSSFTGSSGGGTSVFGRFGDFVISRLFTNTFSCVSVRFSRRLKLDVAVVSGSGSVSPPVS